MIPTVKIMSLIDKVSLAAYRHLSSAGRDLLLYSFPAYMHVIIHNVSFDNPCALQQNDGFLHYTKFCSIVNHLVVRVCVHSALT